MTARSEIQAMPHAVMSEKYVLSCMLDHPAMFVPRSASDGIDLDAFHLPGHRLMFEHMKGDFQKTGSLDLTLFVQMRNLDGSLPSMGGAAALSEICTYAADGGGQWTAHAAILREQKAMRLKVLASGRLAEAQDSEEAIHEAKEAVAALQAAVAGPRRAFTGSQAAAQFSGKLQADHAAGIIPGQSCGIHMIDEISGGMRPGELWVVGSRPSRGKSVLLNQVGSAFVRRQEPIAIFSLEMMSHEVVGRMISNMGRVDFTGIMQPRKLSNHDLQSIHATVKTISSAPLWIDATAGQTIETITAEATRIRDSHGTLALVIVDYLQLIRGGRNRNETREEEVARVSGSLKQLAKALQCPVLSASQLNEQGQTRESRAIEQDADVVLFIVDEGIKIGKMRNGVRDSVLNLQLDGRFQRFTER